MNTIRYKIEYQLCDKFGTDAIKMFDIYEHLGHYYVYNKALGIEPMNESPFYYSVLVVDGDDGEILKDTLKIYDGYATIYP